VVSRITWFAVLSVSVCSSLQIGRKLMNIAQYYKDITILVKMQLGDTADYFWQGTLVNPKQARQAQTVVYLGCNVLRTLHLAAQFVRIVKLICQDDVVVLGGPAHCCGFPHSALPSHGEVGKQQGLRAVETFRVLGPRRVILWCPSCVRQYSDKLSVNWKAEDYEMIHATEFLAQNAQLIPQVYSGTPRTVAVHEHADDSRNRENVASVKSLLQQLKGIEVVEVGQMVGFGYHCSTNAEQPSQSFVDCLNASITSDQTQVDTIVSVYHSCHRALIRAAKRQGISCVNYVDLVAERAGKQVPDRFGQFAELGDEELIWAEVADYFPPRDESDARRVIRDFFGSQNVLATTPNH